LDYEQIAEMEFHVRVSDLGKPKLTSETVARVRIALTDVNDCPPQFSQSEYNATVIVPTYNNVAVVQVRKEKTPGEGRGRKNCSRVLVYVFARS
jgi:protocadherin Fat 1/2/3